MGEPYKAGINLWKDIKYIWWLHRAGVEFEIINKGHNLQEQKRV